MDQDSTGNSNPSNSTNWVSIACIVGLLVLTVFVIVMFVVGSKYGPPAQPEPAAATAGPAETNPPEPGAAPVPMPKIQSDEQPSESPDSGEQQAEPPADEDATQSPESGEQNSADSPNPSGG